MKIPRLLIFILPSLLFVPSILYAAGGATFESLVTGIQTSIFSPLIPVLFGLALIVFFWGLIQYLRSGLGDKQVEEAKSLMLWGVIIIFVMVSVWGLVKILTDTFFSGAPTVAPTPPKF